MAFPVVAGLGLAKLGLDTFRTIKASKALKKLGRYPELTETPELAAKRYQADEMAKRGFTGAERSYYEQQRARQQNTAYQRTADRSRGLAQVALAGLDYGNVNSLNAFAAEDARRRAENFRYSTALAQQFQARADANIKKQQERRDELEKQLGITAQALPHLVDESFNTILGGAAYGLGSQLGEEGGVDWASQFGFGRKKGPGGYGLSSTDPGVGINPSRIG